MVKMYFTFGSWEGYPHKNTYLVVVGTMCYDCMNAFRDKYPDIHENTVNCASYYTESKWEEHGSKLYEGVEPAEVIITKSAKHEMTHKLLVDAVAAIGRNSGYWYDKEKRKQFVCERIGTTEEELRQIGVDLEEVLA